MVEVEIVVAVLSSVLDCASCEDGVQGGIENACLRSAAGEELR